MVFPNSFERLISYIEMTSIQFLNHTETILEAVDDGCTSAPAFRYMVYDGIGTGKVQCQRGTGLIILIMEI